MRTRIVSVVAGVLGALLAVVSAPSAMAQGTKVVVAYTAVSDFASGFIASERGLFKKRGLDVEWKLVPLNSLIPAALEAGSVQIGGTTTSVLLQAADGGLDHVSVVGSGATDKDQNVVGILLRNEVAYSKPSDFEGKKIGVPGIGAFLQVIFVNWLLDKGVDVKKVQFVEVGFPQMADVMKSGNVDGVVTGEPFKTRIISAKLGKMIANFTDNLKSELPVIVYSATRKWAGANMNSVRAFREAVAEAIEIANQDHEAVRASLPNYIKLPPEVIASLKFGRWNAEVTDAGIKYWIEIMKRQGLLRGELDASRIVLR